LFPLQIGDADTIFVVAIGLVLFVIVIILILYGVRRSTAITDELAKDRELKSMPIRPAANLQVKEKQQSSPPRDEARDLESNSPLQAELRDNKTELQHSLLEIATLRENEAAMKKEIDGLRTEISALKESLLSSPEEIREPRGSISQTTEPRIASRMWDIQPHVVRESRSAVEHPRRGGWTLRIFGSNPPSRACPNCKRRLGPKDRYCDSCGRSVTPLI
jgi:hypothetical protein